MENKDHALLPATLVTNPVILHDPNNIYSDEGHPFQGIPSIACTKGGQYYAIWYAGLEEGNGNFALVFRSKDGINWGKSIMAILPPTLDTRCYDPTIWVDPMGRLWLFWAQSHTWYDGRCGVWCAICDDPDAENPVFAPPRRIANGIMMNKPTVLADGSWLLPCAVWASIKTDLNHIPEERFSNVYRSTDNGETFTLLGGADYPRRTFDEHMVYEKADGTLVMLIRGTLELGKAESTDGGFTWTPAIGSGIPTPDARFCIRRLKSGRLLLVNHKNFKGRNNMTAMLSDDDGATWSEGLLIDERNDVSYPDFDESPDGFINIIYDLNRYKDEEIYYAHITEEDILAGKLANPNSALKRLVNKATGAQKVTNA